MIERNVAIGGSGHLTRAMWPYHPHLLERPVPRYTSYPTAVEFADRVGDAQLRDALADVAGDISLYVHIPYCEKICWYCGCNTGAANRTQRLEAYLDALTHDIALLAAQVPARARVTRIAFGGGSPNAIPPLAFVRLVDRLRTKFGIVDDPLLSVELDPRGMTDEWAAVLGSVGVRNASLGVQTFDPAIQAAIGRVQPLEHVSRTVTMLRAAGVQSLNFDLMYGLPGQDLKKLDDTLERAVALGADRIALFGYAHVPNVLPRQRQIDATGLPGQAERFAMAAHGFDRLTAAGYVPIGFDHFAKPGDAMAAAAAGGTIRRNFQGFTDDPAEVLLGLGASAISMFPDRIIQNEKNAGRYRMRLSQDRLPAALGVMRTRDDRERAMIIEDLLCDRLADVSIVALAPEAEQVLAACEALGLVDRTTNGLRITAEGRPYARVIAAQFDAYRNGGLRQSSQAV